MHFAGVLRNYIFGDYNASCLHIYLSGKKHKPRFMFFFSYLIKQAKYNIILSNGRFFLRISKIKANPDKNTIDKKIITMNNEKFLMICNYYQRLKILKQCLIMFLKNIL